MLYLLAEYVQHFLYIRNRPASKSFYEQMLIQKRLEADIVEHEQRRLLEATKQEREFKVRRLFDRI